MINSMAIVSTGCSSLELTMSMPGFSASTSVRDLDINQIPRSGDQVSPSMEFEEEDEDEEMSNNINNNSNNSNNNIGSTRKKLRLTKEQSRLLEETFRQHHTLNPKQKEALALQLKLRSRQVEVWFQNRRARSKLKQTEMECEYLKRWFGSLTEQNRRLQREVEELRAMKVGPATVMSPNSRDPLPVPASSLTMCPRCERVSSTASDHVGPTSATPNS